MRFAHSPDFFCACVCILSRLTPNVKDPQRQRVLPAPECIVTSTGTAAAERGGALLLFDEANQAKETQGDTARCGARPVNPV